MKGKRDARAAPTRNNSVRGRLTRMDVRGALRQARAALRSSIEIEDPISSQSDESDDGVAPPQRQPGAEVSAQRTSNEGQVCCAAVAKCLGISPRSSGTISYRPPLNPVPSSPCTQGDNSHEDYWKDFKNAHKNPDNGNGRSAEAHARLKRTHNIMPIPVRKSLAPGQSGISVCPFKPTRVSVEEGMSTPRVSLAPGFATGGTLASHSQEGQKEADAETRPSMVSDGNARPFQTRPSFAPWEANPETIAEKKSVPIGQRLDDAEDHRKHRGQAISRFEKKGELSTQLATTLEMDHIFIPFSTFVWGIYFVGMNAAVLWM